MRGRQNPGDEWGGSGESASQPLSHFQALNTYTKPLTIAQAAKLRDVLEEKGYEFESKPYTLYAATGPKVNIAVYEKGPKVVAQGKGTVEFVQFTLEPLVLGQAELGYEEVNNPEMFSPHIGVDESGKGDYFGPLVIAGVYVDGIVARHLKDEGIMDSKRISSDARIETLAKVIRATPGLVWNVVAIGPERYNDMYDSFGNLNRLLAWGHARVIENLLEKVPGCPRALSDQFANPTILQRALKEKGREIELVQRTKAESDPAVAAASILAREAFVRWMREAGEARGGVPLPKGASPAVKVRASEIVDNEGKSGLKKVAKLHFRTTFEL